MPPEKDSTPRAALVAGVIFEAAIVGAAFGVGAIVGVAPLATLRLDARDAAIGAAAVVPMLGLFFVVLKSRFAPFVRIREVLDEHLLPMFRHAGAADLLALAALAGLGEEMLFRGVLQPALETFAGRAAALAAASLLFGLAHAVTRTYVVIAALIGAYLGGLWLFTGNLLAPIVAHALYDFVALIVWLHVARRREASP